MQGERDHKQITKKINKDVNLNDNQAKMELSKEILTSIRRITKTDSNNLIEKYGSIKDIILVEDYNEFSKIDGIGPSKVESLK